MTTEQEMTTDAVEGEEGRVGATVDRRLLLEALSNVAAFCSPDMTRPVMTAVRMAVSTAGVVLTGGSDYAVAYQTVPLTDRAPGEAIAPWMALIGPDVRATIAAAFKKSSLPGLEIDPNPSILTPAFKIMSASGKVHCIGTHAEYGASDFPPYDKLLADTRKLDVYGIDRLALNPAVIAAFTKIRMDGKDSRGRAKTGCPVPCVEFTGYGDPARPLTFTAGPVTGLLMSVRVS